MLRVGTRQASAGLAQIRDLVVPMISKCDASRAGAPRQEGVPGRASCPGRIRLRVAASATGLWSLLITAHDDGSTAVTASSAPHTPRGSALCVAMMLEKIAAWQDALRV